MNDLQSIEIENIIAETEKMIQSAAERYGEYARLNSNQTAYALALSYALGGYKILTVKDLPKCVHIQKSLAGECADAPSAAGLALLLSEEVRTACETLQGQADSGFIPDIKIRRMGRGLALGDYPALAVVMGAASDAREAVNTVNDYTRRAIPMLIGGTIAQQTGPQTAYGSGISLIGKENALPNAISAIVRFALIFGGVCAGDRQSLRSYIKMNLPVFINAFGGLNSRDVRLLEGAAALGIPVLCDRQTESAHLIGAANHREMIEKSLHLRGISLEGTRGPDIPVSYCATYEDEPSAGESCARLDVSFGLVLARKVAYVKDHAVSVIGPDISAEGAALPLGIIAEIYGHRMKSEYEAVIEKNIPRWLSRAEGITYAASETKGACIRIGRQAFNRGMRVAHLGEIIYAGIKSDYEAVADKCAVTLVTDGKTVQTLKNDAAQPKYAMRRALRPPQDTYACTLCKKIARGCGCTVTQYKPGACAAVTLQDAKLFSETMRTSVKKLDSADEAVYSVCAGQKTGFGGFTCVSAVIPKAKGVIVLDDAYTGDTPLKLKYCEIAAQTDGAFSTPGYMGHCKEFIASEKYMAPEGGLARIVWMPKALKETLREKIDETARALYGIQNFSDMICDETVTTESETLIDFLVKENHPVIGMDELI